MRCEGCRFVSMRSVKEHFVEDPVVEYQYNEEEDL